MTGAKQEAEGNLRTLFAEQPYIEPPTAEERIAWVERRHLFWRNRSLEHARTIDKQLAELKDLRAVVSEFLKIDQPDGLRELAVKALYGNGYE